MRPIAKAKPQREPTIALINIVFLMLVFFMVAGTLSQPLDSDLNLVETHDTVRLLPDRALPARRLVELTRELRGAGAERVMLVTERALQ